MQKGLASLWNLKEQGWVMKPCKVVLTFESVDESYWAVLSYGTVYYAVQDGCNFWVCGWNPKVWPLIESYWAVLSCRTVYYAVQGGSNFWVCGWNPMVWPFKWKLLSSTFLWYCLLRCSKVVLTFESVDEILKCDHSNKTSLAVPLNGAICLSAIYKVKFYIFV